MNKFSITAGTVALGLTTADARAAFLQRCFKNLRFHRTARAKAGPLEGVDSQLIDESRWEPATIELLVVRLNPFPSAVTFYHRELKGKF